MSAETNRVAMHLAFVDWVRAAEREAFRLGVMPMPPQWPGEPEWLRQLRRKPEGRK